MSDSPSDVLQRAAQAHQAYLDAERLRKQTLDERRRAIKGAHQAGMTFRDIAKHLGISPARAQRTAEGNAPKKRRHALVSIEL